MRSCSLSVCRCAGVRTAINQYDVAVLGGRPSCCLPSPASLCGRCSGCIATLQQGICALQAGQALRRPWAEKDSIQEGHPQVRRKGRRTEGHVPSLKIACVCMLGITIGYRGPYSRRDIGLRMREQEGGREQKLGGSKEKQLNWVACMGSRDLLVPLSFSVFSSSSIFATTGRSKR